MGSVDKATGKRRKPRQWIKEIVLDEVHQGSEYNYKKHLLLDEKPCVQCKLASNDAREKRRLRQLKLRGPREHHNVHCGRCGAYVAVEGSCKNCKDWAF